MIIRIVKMTFQGDKLHQFHQIFEQSGSLIRQFPGCLYLKLLQDVKQPHIYFTYSKWEDEEALENYRRSVLFTNTWAKTKVLFAAKPEAVSLQSILTVGAV